MSLGSCPSGIYPFGIALLEGWYSVSNASQGTPLRVFPTVPCPLLVRYITGYLFSPSSDQALILPTFQSNVAILMASNLTLNGNYAGLAGSGSNSSFSVQNTHPQPLVPGLYTVVAGDEWGALTAVHIWIGGQNSSSSTTSSSTTAVSQQNGTLIVSLDIGPTTPICRTNSTVGPADAQYRALSLVISSSTTGRNLTSLHPNWLSNGCEVYSTAQASLAPQSYAIDLSSCPFMGCGASLPKAFSISRGQTTRIDVSIDTGIR